MPKMEEKIRQLWVIHVLIDCKKRKQQKLIDEITSRAIPVFDDSDSEIKEKFGKKISNTLGKLKNEGIVDRKNDEETRDKWVWIEQDNHKIQKALYNILKKLHDPDLTRVYFTESGEGELNHENYDLFCFFRDYFLSSTFAERVINDKLVKYFSETLKVPIDIREMKVVLTILKLSTKALLNTFESIERLKYLNHVLDEIDLNNEIKLKITKTKKHKVESKDKERWFTNLQKDLSEEINSHRYNPPFNVVIYQNTETTIAINKDIEPGSIDSNQIIALIHKNPKSKIMYNQKDITSPLGNFRENKKNKK